jgi:hypothetical protein
MPLDMFCKQNIDTGPVAVYGKLEKTGDGTGDKVYDGPARSQWKKPAGEPEWGYQLYCLTDLKAIVLESSCRL